MTMTLIVYAELQVPLRHLKEVFKSLQQSTQYIVGAQ